MKKLVPIITLAFIGLALSACNGSSLPISTHYTEEELENIGETIETPWTDYSTPATSVTFPEEELNIQVEKGASYIYNPTMSPKAADLNSLIWTSSNENVATINNGVVTAVGGGNATITASSKVEELEPVELNVTVYVKLVDFTVSETALDLGYEESAKLSVSYEPLDTTQKGVTFHSSNSDIVYVSEDGVVIAGNSDGNAKISVTSDFINLVKEVDVTVRDKVIHVDQVSITNKIENLEVDKTYRLTTTVAPEDAVDLSLTYSSSDTSVAEISVDGLITAKEAGTTTISAISNERESKFDSFELTVFEVVADTIELDATDLELALNATSQLHHVYKKSGEVVTPSRTNLTYSSDNPLVATVTSQGLVSARSVGEANITLTDGNLSTSILVSVIIPIFEYTITDLPDWTPDYGSDVFVWYWGGSFQSVFTKVTLTYDSEVVEEKTVYSNVKAKFNAPSDITNFLLVRCKNGTTVPNWEITYGDVDGRIYQKTADIAVSSGVTNYAINEWIDYPELTPYTLHYTVDGTNWNDVNLTGKDDNQEFYIENFELTAESIFIIHMNEDWRGYYDIKAGSPALSNLDPIEESNNIKVKETGSYDIYCKVTADSDGYIWIDLHDKSQDPIDIDPDATYSVQIGENAISLTKGQLSPEEIIGGAESKYSSNHDVKAGERIAFKCNGEAINDHIGPNQDGSEEFNNYMQDADGFVIQADCENALVEITIYQDGYSFWISGGNSSTHKEVLEPGYYLVGSFNNWFASKEYKLSEDKDDANHYYIDDVTLDAAAELQVNDGDTVWFTNASTWDNCGFTIVNNNIVVTEQGTYKINLYVNSDNGNHITLEKKGDAPVETIYYLVGTFNEWKHNDNYKLTKVNDNEFNITGIEIHANDVLQINSNNDEWFTNKSTWTDCGFELLNNGDVKVLADGVYTVTLYLTSEYDNHITLAKTGDITPSSKTLSSIAITTEPTKKEYTVGEELDLSGMVVTATYDDDSTAPVTGYETSGFDSSTAVESQTITVTYQGKTATFTVKINNPVVNKTKIYFDVTNLDWWENDDAETYVYAYKGETKVADWPGLKMTKEAKGLYSVEIDNIAQYDYFIFCRVTKDGDNLVVQNRTSKDNGVAINKSSDWSTNVVWKITSDAVDYDDGNYTGSWVELPVD